MEGTNILMGSLFHHTALSVRDPDESKEFYESLGFSEVHRWDAADKSMTIIHLKIEDAVLELFHYAENKEVEPLDLAVANDLPSLGVKHIGIQVEDVRQTFNDMKRAGYEIGNEAVKSGKTKIDYFFVKDPDGMWVEIVQDDRGY